MKDLSYEELCSLLDEKMKIVENPKTPLFDLVQAYKESLELINSAKTKLEFAKEQIMSIEKDSIDNNQNKERLPF
ncbi:exodeoxyribonuclease VII small subunit [Campylobacter canadensis]|uniref:Exodeoxyribonuclease VII small subunit n=1 Tax=Campylobacter canadensis TaxID=449520 RepID=A0ABS7WS70_9BACT|nr:exodeoxyribonuclease VII small subunit [Campylobacter canadensis]MBZ7987601.1 exodeoxyribonuclease VII small subunit [Campylobacter canadensis]MBZ7994964.1 exodeoxyribonuclease VII small subunit [Campylobacter canadensis]MBZ7996886.1 exodeoxyribonuclease VII small subunit [Campylobacter canadensis]MBZ7998753.1 exodeoxyribonuclease VII small subunit [Campylobacter canadensis]MBZ8000365.1 exodeoxyribonuclease VII small subunit [Campylobacter canadensis]